MNYLLDTNYLIWTLIEVQNIPKPILDILENTSNSIFVSTISLWEISIKQNLGKIELKNINFEDIKTAIRSQGFNFITLEIEDTIKLSKLPRFTDHKDPFDRMLIQQAIIRGYTLISSDKKFKLYNDYGLTYLII